MSIENLNIYKEDYSEIKEILVREQKLLDAKLIILIDKSGQPIVTTDSKNIDLMGICSLIAADYAATNHLASLVGEIGFSTLSHQGVNNNILIQLINERFILAMITKKTTPFGRLKVQAVNVSVELKDIFLKIENKMKRTSVMNSNEKEFSDVEIVETLDDFFEQFK